MKIVMYARLKIGSKGFVKIWISCLKSLKDGILKKTRVNQGKRF